MGPLLSASRPLASLTALFVLWKGFLLLVALGAAVGPDYDTSTSLFFDRLYGNQARVPVLAARLTRWDALYFMHNAREGYVFEQEWAFTAALPLLVRRFISLFASAPPDAAWEPVVAIALVHASHLVAVLALHRLAMVVCGDERLALVASALHVVSPAGLFLSAPYAESPFAALSFAGSLLFALAIKHRRDCVRKTAAVVGAGVAFGLATAFRSNGLSNGLLFAAEAFRCLVVLARKPSLSRLLALVAPVVGGLCVAAGSLVPQFVAWKRFCRDASPGLDPRPWCADAVPSIYTFVQSEYWNVGFLRYWTLNQLPLFLLASPMLAILIVSGLAVLRKPALGLKPLKSGPGQDYRIFSRATAAGQVLVALLAITNYHVQIITRLSSGYPLWYLWVAGLLLDARQQECGRAITVFMIMYAAIQGALFASFLPPA